MNLKIEQQKLPNLNNKETRLIKLNRASGTCGTNKTYLCDRSLGEEEEGGAEKVFEEIMAEKFSNL